MLRWDSGVRCGYFPKRLGTVLKYASVWSLTTAVDVVVGSIDTGPARPIGLQASPVCIDLHPFGGDPGYCVQLYAWLADALPFGFDVAYEASYVRVTFAMRRLGPHWSTSSAPAT